jgi:hypothetical protein
MLLGNNIVANTGTEGGAIVGRDSYLFRFERIPDTEGDSFYA